MEKIFFLPRYKISLINKTKNTTIRYGNELGKYRIGNVYHAVSYSGRIDFGLNIKITNVKTLKICELADFNIPKGTIKKLERETNGPVELIRFKVVD